MKSSEKEIIAFMETNLSNKDLAIDLVKANELLINACKLFNENGFEKTALKLNGICNDLDEVFSSSNNISEASFKINNTFKKVAVDVNFDDELLKLDLNDNEIQYLEDLILSEMDFEEES